MRVETFSGLIAHNRSRRIYEAAVALESAPEEQPVAGKKKAPGFRKSFLGRLRGASPS
jgi:hypothetical protein